LSQLNGFQLKNYCSTVRSFCHASPFSAFTFYFALKSDDAFISVSKLQTCVLTWQRILEVANPSSFLLDYVYRALSSHLKFEPLHIASEGLAKGFQESSSSGR